MNDGSERASFISSSYSLASFYFYSYKSFSITLANIPLPFGACLEYMCFGNEYSEKFSGLTVYLLFSSWFTFFANFPIKPSGSPSEVDEERRGA